jgi:hypothetical protein
MEIGATKLKGGRPLKPRTYVDDPAGYVIQYITDGMQ